jgi:hypothetical protein
MWVVLVISAVGLVISEIVHFSTYFGFDPQELGPSVFLLHIGVFAVMIPAILLQNGSSNRRGNSKSLKNQFSHAPRWMSHAAGVLFAYAIVNFIVSILLLSSFSGKSPTRQPNGTYTVRRDGTTVPITSAEYHRFRSVEIRLFSGHWMMFYAFATTAMLSAIRKTSLSVQDVPVARLAPISASSILQRRLDYGRHDETILPIWLHAAITIGMTMIGWIGLPMVMAFGVIPRLPKSMGWTAVLLFLGSAFVGGLVPSGLFKQFVAARCPKCGGPAKFASSKPLQYRCVECGALSGQGVE